MVSSVTFACSLNSLIFSSSFLRHASAQAEWEGAELARRTKKCPLAEIQSGFSRAGLAQNDDSLDGWAHFSFHCSQFLAKGMEKWELLIETCTKMGSFAG